MYVWLFIENITHHPGVFFTFCLLPDLAGVTVSNTISYQLTPGKPGQISISSDDVLNFHVAGVNRTSQFLLMQVYTQHAQLTLTATSTTSPVSTTGNSVGMVTMLAAGAAKVSWSVAMANSSVSAGGEVSAVVLVQEYAENGNFSISS